MRRRDDDGGLEDGSELGWMFEASPDDLQVPVPEVTSSRLSQWRKEYARKSAAGADRRERRGLAAGRKKKRKRQRPSGIRALVAGYEDEEGPWMSVAAWTSLVIAACMLVHEVLAKSVSNGIALFVLAIPPITGLYTAAQRWEHKRVEAAVVKELFLKGFGPGFLLLLFIEMFCAVTILGYFCYGADCSDTMDNLRDISVLRDLRQLAKLLYQTSPLRGVLVAFVLCFFTAGLLEETTKLFFVSSAIRFGLQPKRASVLASPSLPSPPPPFPGSPLAPPPAGAPPGMAHRPASILGGAPVMPDMTGPFGGAPGFGTGPSGAPTGAGFGFGAAPAANDGGLFRDAERGAAAGDGGPAPVDVALLEPEGKPNPDVTSGHGIVVYFIAFSAGLATSESMLYLICLAHSPPDALHLALARLCFSLPMHAACGCFTGLGLIERYLKSGLSWFRVLLPAVILHGLYDFLLLLLRVSPLIDYLSEDQVEHVKYALSLLILAGTLHVLRRRLRVFFHRSHH